MSLQHSSKPDQDPSVEETEVNQESENVNDLFPKADIIDFATNEISERYNKWLYYYFSQSNEHSRNMGDFKAQSNFFLKQSPFLRNFSDNWFNIPHDQEEVFRKKLESKIVLKSYSVPLVYIRTLLDYLMNLVVRPFQKNPQQITLSGKNASSLWENRLDEEHPYRHLDARLNQQPQPSAPPCPFSGFFDQESSNLELNSSFQKIDNLSKK